MKVDLAPRNGRPGTGLDPSATNLKQCETHHRHGQQSDERHSTRVLTSPSVLHLEREPNEWHCRHPYLGGLVVAIK
jgi:hypothetical protein